MTALISSSHDHIQYRLYHYQFNQIAWNIEICPSKAENTLSRDNYICHDMERKVDWWDGLFILKSSDHLERMSWYNFSQPMLHISVVAYFKVNWISFSFQSILAIFTTFLKQHPLQHRPRTLGIRYLIPFFVMWCLKLARQSPGLLRDCFPYKEVSPTTEMSWTWLCRFPAIWYNVWSKILSSSQSVCKWTKHGAYLHLFSE